MHIITGTIAYDYIMDFPGIFSDHILPEQIHKINLSFNVNKFEKRRGGTAGNVSYTLALLDTKHRLLSYGGNDFDEYKKVFLEMKIDLRDVHIDKEEHTSTGFAMTDKTDNQIWGFFVGSSKKTEKLKLPSNVSNKDLVLVGPSSTKGSMNFVRQCILRKIPYIFDPGFLLPQISDKELSLGIKNAEYIIGNDYEIDLIKSRIKNWKEIIKYKVIIKTLGKNGTEVLDHGKLKKIKPVIVKNPVDPTGAGDAWRGGFIAGLERKFDLETCAQMGSVAAAYAVEKYGTQEHKYTLSEFKNRYRHTYKILLDL